MSPLLLVAVAAAACPALPAALDADVTAVFDAWVRADGLEAAWARLEADRACPAAPVTPELAARVHTAAAMAAIVRKEPTRALAAARAARAAAPGWSPPDEVAPPGSTLRALFDEVPPDGELLALPTSPGEHWWVDGATPALPRLVEGRAAWVQHQPASSDELRTWYLAEVQELPAELRPAAPVRRSRVGWAVGGGAAVAAGVAGLAVSAWAHDAYLASPVGDPGLADLEAVNAGAGAAGVGLVVLGGAALAVGVFGGEF